MFVVEMVVDVVVGLFARVRKSKARTPREPWSVRRSRARMNRQREKPSA